MNYDQTLAEIVKGINVLEQWWMGRNRQYDRYLTETLPDYFERKKFYTDLFDRVLKESLELKSTHKRKE